MTNHRFSRRVAATVTALGLSLGLLHCPQTALASILTVDQQNTAASSGTCSTYWCGQLAQSFTPSLPGITWAEFTFVNSDELSMTIQLDVRAGSLGGITLGSTTGTVPSSGGVFHFDFASTIPLTPGQLYVLVPVQFAGEAQAVVLTGNSYFGGTAIIQNSVAPGNDFWFREGVSVPEPAPLLLLGAGAAALLLLRRRFHRSA